ncbi:hypothetical protein PG993_003114 [Apiospora rasikravindrae]|uniref:Heterokaryon incompatibility domain-containing protein n=1 Tax=Apiospora rasikravindrae TaxID=990691 RepID=A0ABR1TYL7_9PEZI
MAGQRPSFGLEEIESHWPSRLLRVTDFTSFPKEVIGNECRYGPAVYPRYNIISYTWGRYRAKPDEDGTAIDIQGVPWPVPRIKCDPSAEESSATGFRSDQFEQVLYKIGQDTQFVWVDVGCIPQKGGRGYTAELQTETDVEIAHQAGIFHRADQAYVWLHQMSTGDLSQAIEGLCHHDWRRAKMLFADPWFTSLWTLQEGYLRKDAILLSRDGDDVTFPRNSSAVTLGDLMRLTDAIVHRGQAMFYEQFRYAGVETMLSKNPLVLLGVVPHRTVSPDDENDKVCGIMQIFGLKLNRSNDFDDLCRDFAEQIVCKSPVVSQAFTHPIPNAEPSWRIPIPEPSVSSVSIGISYREGGGRPQTPYDHTKMVPKEFYDMVEIWWEGRAQVSFDGSGAMTFEGRVINLRNMQRILEDSNPSERLGDDPEHTEELQYVNGKRINSCHCSVYLDKGNSDGSNPFAPMRRDPLNQMPADPLREIERLINERKGGHVLVLGKFKAGHEVAYLGILTRRFRDGNTVVQRRFGFCTWNVELDQDEYTFNREVIY